MWLYTLATPVLICVAIGLPILILKSKSDKVFLWEYLVLILPVLVWNFLSMSGVGSESLANISEVYVLSVLVVIYLVFRSRGVSMGPGAKAIGTVCLLILPIILRLLFPSLPE